MAAFSSETYAYQSTDAANSIEDPIGVGGRVHFLSNESAASQTWSSVGATPFIINGVPTASLIIPPGESRQIWSTNANWVVLPASTTALQLPTVTTPARTFNTDFIPSATRPVLCTYGVSIDCTSTLSLLSSDSGRVELRSNLGAPTTVRSTVSNLVTQTLGRLVGSRTRIGGTITFLAPAGWTVRIASVVLTATPTFAFESQCEIIL